jgi:hypothetical protein
MPSMEPADDGLGRLAVLPSTTLYRTENGDIWTLVHDLETGRTTVRHQPNLASGGYASEVGLDAFLTSSGDSPEQVAARLWQEQSLSSPPFQR